MLQFLCCTILHETRWSRQQHLSSGLNIELDQDRPFRMSFVDCPLKMFVHLGFHFRSHESCLMCRFQPAPTEHDDS